MLAKQIWLCHSRVHKTFPTIESFHLHVLNIKTMFNLFKNNTTEDFAQFSNEEITEITKEEAKRAPKSGVVPIKIEAQPPFLYPPFTQEEVDSFLEKVNLATLNNIAPTPYSILNKDIPAVKFRGWAEVSTLKEEEGKGLASNTDQLNYTLDEKGMPENVREKGTKTDDVNGFADSYLTNSFSYAMEQPWAVFTKEECKPYLFVSPNGEVSVKTTRLQQYAGKTRRAGNEQANILYKQRNPEEFTRTEVINGEIKFFVAVVSFHKAGGEKASYWKHLAWGLENNPKRKTAVTFIKNYSKPEDDMITIYKLCKMKGIDVNDESTETQTQIHNILRDNLVGADKFPKYRNKLMELSGKRPVTDNYTKEGKIEFCKDKGIRIVNMRIVGATGNKQPMHQRVKPWLQDGVMYLSWSFKGSGSGATGVKDGDYDRRCFETCNQLLSTKGVNKVVVIADCLENSADHIVDIRHYKKNQMIKDQVQLMLSALKTLSVKPQQFDELTHFDYSKIEFRFLPQITQNDEPGVFC